MENIFDTIFNNGATESENVLLCLALSLLCGVVFATMCWFRSTSSKSFLISTALIPVAVTLVISLVNGNIGAGVAIAGAFSLVRFRSLPGTAKEICIIFIAMASGLAFGMGYVFYGFLFAIGSGVILIVCSLFGIWDRRAFGKERVLTITIPENLNYTTVFEDLFAKYTTKHDIIRVKTTNLGSLFKITYRVTYKRLDDEKAFFDELRCRNGNLEIMSQLPDNSIEL